ncbi:hypothetical protein CU044_6473 [Streptomyces sp. L-9-10]|uniref:hypothetical protein n=1 Tax=Streptomyces sp. L-9-10 TaxID=1478131 RepID=UPI0010DA6903|nr:hypothetical protein [Streptomyces sp. L-9-10]RYJ21327.1 hypothetical protein CU044_6473 [Streptomyces sp. L-9-10]
MSETWPRRGIIKFVGAVMDGAGESAYGLLDCAARVDGKARETVLVLLEDEKDKDTTGTREDVRSAQARVEELKRLWAELAAMEERIGRLAEATPSGQEPVGGRSPVTARG